MEETQLEINSNNKYTAEVQGQWLYEWLPWKPRYELAEHLIVHIADQIVPFSRANYKNAHPGEDDATKKFDLDVKERKKTKSPLDKPGLRPKDTLLNQHYARMSSMWPWSKRF